VLAGGVHFKPAAASRAKPVSQGNVVVKGRGLVKNDYKVLVLRAGKANQVLTPDLLRRRATKQQAYIPAFIETLQCFPDPHAAHHRKRESRKLVQTP
jgi:hypothetical protein